MGRVRLAVVLPGLAWLAATAVHAAPPPSIERPQWVRKPTAEEFQRHYPKMARDYSLTGRAVVGCVVDAQGALTNCRADSEEPKGAGFGEAAVAILSTYLTMAPNDQDGAPVVGRAVTVPLRFVLPEGWIAAPDWARKPSADQMASVIPTRAYEKGVNGAATIACAVDLEGKLQDCAIEREEPKGFGFGAAALRAARYFQMRPLMIDGKASEGGRARVPIEFNMGR